MRRAAAGGVKAGLSIWNCRPAVLASWVSGNKRVYATRPLLNRVKAMKAVLVSCMIAAGILSAAGAHFVAKMPGSEPYTPTKLEWLAVELNAERGGDYAEGLMLMFRLEHKTDTIVATVVHRATHRGGTIDDLKQFGERSILEYAKARNWDWVKAKSETRLNRGF